jgi:BirA family biotin operon repressor/biotin-[acetyl-CoA-carboxylase] ligase
MVQFEVSRLKALLCSRQIGATRSEPKFEIHLLDTVVSTNSTLWEWIEQGAGEGTVAIALQQQTGRGQWGRQWLSLPGGLYLSLALMPNLNAQQSGQLTLCIAWGIGFALREQGIPVKLKWPNDLVVDGLKLGGILTETRIQQNRIAKAVVGVGINYCNPVPKTGINLAQVQAKYPEMAIASLEELAAIVLTGAMQSYYYWQQNGIEAILPAYHQLMDGIGTTLQWKGQVGQIMAVTPSGNLKIRLQIQAYPPVHEEIDLQPGTVSLGYVRQNIHNSEQK